MARGKQYSNGYSSNRYNVAVLNRYVLVRSRIFMLNYFCSSHSGHLLVSKDVVKMCMCVQNILGIQSIGFQSRKYFFQIPGRIHYSRLRRLLICYYVGKVCHSSYWKWNNFHGSTPRLKDIIFSFNRSSNLFHMQLASVFLPPYQTIFDSVEGDSSISLYTFNMSHAGIRVKSRGNIDRYYIPLGIVDHINSRRMWFAYITLNPRTENSIYYYVSI